MQEFKDRLVLLCQQKIQERISSLKEELSGLKSSMENETKSSVGDKHETARARMQAEEETLKGRLKETEEQLNLLPQTDKKLIYTDTDIFFLAIPLGKVDLEGQTIYVISTQSPIGRELRMVSKGQRLTFNAKVYQILDVC